MNPKYKPNKDLIRYIKETFKEKSNLPPMAVLDKNIQKVIITGSYAATAWIKSKEGAQFVFNLFGIERCDPHMGFNYKIKNTATWVNRTTLTIYRYLGADKPNLPRSAINTMKRVLLFEQQRDHDNWAIIDDDSCIALLDYFRSWLKTPPGTQWAKDVFSPVRYIGPTNSTVYKWQFSPESSRWMLNNEIIFVPIQTSDTCDSCGLSIPCIDKYTGIGTLCNHCYAEHMAEPDLLKECARQECRSIECGNILSDIQVYEKIDDELPF